MSSPKDIQPEPRYSLNVFNGNLNTVFQLQAQIKELVKSLQLCIVSNHDLNIHFDCKQELQQLDNSIKKALTPLIFNYKGSFGQSSYDKIKDEIYTKTSKLRTLKNNLGKLQANFFEKKNDYESYLQYLKFNDNSKISFSEFKSNILIYYEKEIKTNHPRIYTDTKSKIEGVEYEKQNEKFSFGFNSKYENKKSEIIDYLAHKEGEINLIRSQTSDKILDLSTGDIIIIPSSKKTEKTEELICKIRKEIVQCDDLEFKKNYNNQLEKLLKSESLTGEYFYKELFDSIFLSEKNRLRKIELTKTLVSLNNTDFHLNIAENKSQFAQKITRTLNQSRITDADVKYIKKEYQYLLNKSNTKKEEDSIAEKERLFLKSQIITTLTNLGYEVMDDLNVIDFERNSDYLLKVKGQENYINLIFREDGSLKYNFQIPENKDNLSTDEIKLKLNEMQLTCNDFKSVLNDLSKMGLKMTYKNEKPISKSTLMSFTKKTKEKLKTKLSKKSQIQKRQQIQKKRYLDN